MVWDCGGCRVGFGFVEAGFPIGVRSAEAGSRIAESWCRVSCL